MFNEVRNIGKLVVVIVFFFLIFPVLMTGMAHAATLGNPFPVAATQGQEGAISAAFDGTNYLVGIQGDATAHNKITAQLISQSGTLVGSRISVGRTGGAPLVAFDGTNYLMVWFDDAISNGQLYGVFISKSGFVNTPFVIDPGPLSVSRDIGGVAFGGGQYMTVYYKTESGAGKDIVYGRLVSSSGTVGNEIRISSGYGSKSLNNVAFDGTNFFVVWDNHANNNEVKGRFVSPSGTPGTEITVKPSGLPNDNPLTVAFDGTNYLVVWTDQVETTPNNWDVFGQLVTPAGALSGAKISISTAPGPQFFPLIAFDGTNYLISWTDMRNDVNGNWSCDSSGEGTCWDIRGQFVSKSGVLVGSELIINNDAGNQMGGFGGQAVNGKLFGLIDTGVNMAQGSFGDVYGVSMTVEKIPMINYAIDQGMNLYLYDTVLQTMDTVIQNNDGMLASLNIGQTMLVYTKFLSEDPNNGIKTYQMCLYNIASKTTNCLTTPTVEQDAVAFDNNGRILFIDKSGDGLLKRMNPDGTNITTIAMPLSPYRFNVFWLSPDRQKIIAVEETHPPDYNNYYTTNLARLVLMNADGSGRTVIKTEYLGQWNVLFWNADSSKIFYFYNTFNVVNGAFLGKTPHYVVIDIPGGTATDLTGSAVGGKDGNISTFTKSGNLLSLMYHELYNGQTGALIAVRADAPSMMEDRVGFDRGGEIYFANLDGTNFRRFVESSTTSGVCGTANGQAFTSAPVVNLCSVGTPTSVAGSGPWTWSCAGSDGGTPADCTANIQTWTVTPSAGSGGIISPNSAQTVNHGSTASFSVALNAGYTASVGGTCGGTLSGYTYTTNPITGNCTVTATFSATPINGTCGTSNGQAFASAPTANLCSVGPQSSVSGNGPWTWSCVGSNGGSTASCSANIRSSVQGVIQLPQTGQTKCYDSAGTEITCTGTGQDGELQAGVAWPSPRFTPGAGTEADCMIDNLTGLMWPKNGNLPNGTKNWNDAIDYPKTLALCGHSDWRLPNINELESLANDSQSNPVTWLNTQGFSNAQSSGYWSSTSVTTSLGFAWYMDMSGRVYSTLKDYDFSVWPVRAGQFGSFGNSVIWQTGQTTSYRLGDDGDLKRGVAWPSPRFTDHNTGEVTDNLTGLIWTKDANVPGPLACSPAVFKTWQGALDYVKCLNAQNYLDHTDWRLPNRKELRSLTDYSKTNPALMSGNPFSSVQNDYWSSTTYAVNTADAWQMSNYGSVGSISKGEGLTGGRSYAWPVRAAQAGTFYNLVIFKSGIGSGTVISTSSGIDCGSRCSAYFNPGTSVTLKATANTGATFTGWSGSGCTDADTCVVAMDAAKTVMAIFTLTPTPVNGACGTSNGQAFTSAPTTNLCSVGTPTSVTGSGPWTWSCAGSDGGTPADCTAAIIQTWTVTPSAGTGGTISPNTPQMMNHNATTQFTVTANAGYATASVGGTCGGSLSGTTYTTNPVTGNCTVSATFTANPVNGACGTSNGQTFTLAPTANLCSAGTPTAVAGSGPWAWSCNGSGGGSTTSCSANIPAWREDFSAPPLDSSWEVRTGLGWPGRYSLTDSSGSLRYYYEGPRAFSGSWTGGTAAGWSPSLTLIRPFNGDQWVLKAKATYNIRWYMTGAQYQVLYLAFGDDSNHYLRISRGTDQWYNANVLTADLVIDGQVVASNNTLRAPNDVVVNDWLRFTYWYEIVRQGQCMIFRYSVDGTNYSTVFSSSLATSVPTQRFILDASVWSTAGSYTDWDYIQVDPTAMPTLGDVNGDSTVNLADSILAFKVMAGMNPAGIVTNYPTCGADVNCDGKVGLTETIYILQKIAGLRIEGPATYSISGTITAGGIVLSDVTVALSGASTATTATDANGKYSFTGLAAGSYTITATKASYTFTPQTVPVNANNVVQDFTGTSTPAEMVLIPAGTFQMGDTIDSYSSAIPVHTVTVSGFYLDKYEVTKALWDEVYAWATAHGYTFDNAGAGTAANHPVQTVLWYDVVKWLNARSEKEGRTPVYYTDAGQAAVYRTGQVNVVVGAVKWTANGYRLPTEAEWEYAARAGTTTRFYTGSCIASDTEANYNGGYPWTGCPTGQYRGATTVVGSFPANPWGLYDMAGNVWEWTWDWYGSYSSSAVTTPKGPDSGSSRVNRGGGWNLIANGLRSTNRISNAPSYRGSNIGFRSALSQP